MESGGHPGAIVGNEESFPLLGSFGGLPVTAQFPLFGLLGLLPLPVRDVVTRRPGGVRRPGAEDGPAPDAISDAVRSRMQACLGERLSRRDTVRGG